VTSQGHARARFCRALLSKNLTIIEAAAAIGHVRLDDALAVLVVMADKKDQRFEREQLREGRLLHEVTEPRARVADPLRVDLRRGSSYPLFRGPKRGVVALEAAAAVVPGSNTPAPYPLAWPQRCWITQPRSRGLDASRR
jgi:hypothetical protein